MQTVRLRTGAIPMIIGEVAAFLTRTLIAVGRPGPPPPSGAPIRGARPAACGEVVLDVHTAGL